MHRFCGDTRQRGGEAQLHCHKQPLKHSEVTDTPLLSSIESSTLPCISSSPNNNYRDAWPTNQANDIMGCSPTIKSWINWQRSSYYQPYHPAAWQNKNYRPEYLGSLTFTSWSLRRRPFNPRCLLRSQNSNSLTDKLLLWIDRYLQIFGLMGILTISSQYCAWLITTQLWGRRS